MISNDDLGQRLLEIHGLSGSRPISEDPMELRCAEFDALVATSLGRDYDREKVGCAAEVQASMAKAQLAILKQYEDGEISADEYVQQFNSEAITVYWEIEINLGTGDFCKLFGGRPEESGGLIDKDMFLVSLTQLAEESHALRARSEYNAEIAYNSANVCSSGCR